MTYHSWGEKGVDWEGIENASYYIGDWLAKWVRMPVFQCKEKFGTVRVYCAIGWESFYSIWRPKHAWVVKWWPYKLDLTVSQYLMPLLNKIVVPIHRTAYRFRYKQAIKDWPHLKDEILECADFGEYLKGL